MRLSSIRPARVEWNAELRRRHGASKRAATRACLMRAWDSHRFAPRGVTGASEKTGGAFEPSGETISVRTKRRP